ncbi:MULTISPECIES: phage portal protein [Acinetobacter]|uniref:phage portal protein n=2 Tax=Moraxellaceae TaxID=468 RepID=UPI000C2BF301|nr:MULTISPECIES: phage portal protein [Acinetobacter]ATZ64252.1 phage portal protein [Acinetobacter bereziniae]
MGLLSKIFRKKSMSPVNGGGWRSVYESFMGAWQRNIELKREDLLLFHAVFACISAISKDIGKLPLELRKKENGIWVKTKDKKLPFFEKPNPFQTMQQFIEYWIISKVTRGNTYVFKRRDAFGNVIHLVVLNPDNVRPLVDEQGNVFYSIGIDRLAGQLETVILPASEIIHDRENCLYHPLVGISRIQAASMAAVQGSEIQKYGSSFFHNMGRPSGILVAPGKIDPDEAKDIQDRWNENYSGNNVGKTAVVGGDMKYIAMSIPASDAQMIEQHKWSAEICCSVMGVPPFKVHIGSLPAGTNPEDMERIYLNSCLQSLIESVENCLDDSFDLKAKGYEVFIEVSGLLRMDSMSQMNFYSVGVKGGIISPNEARNQFNYSPVAGGDSVYMQQQNFSLEALSKRDAKDDPFAGNSGKSTGENNNADS